jgi:hypothetical protein
MAPGACKTVAEAKEMQMLADYCQDFGKYVEAYKAILANPQIDCETVVTIQRLAQNQHLRCMSVIRVYESEAETLMENDRITFVMRDAYRFRDEYGDVNVDDWVKNPACKGSR